MPARSKSQQRLFAMVHAYNKGEFHGSRSLRKRVADLSKHISDEDARHFAETKHDGLPERTEKKADSLSPAIFSRDVLSGHKPARVIRDSDGIVQVIGPRGNAADDALIVAEHEIVPLLARHMHVRPPSHPSDGDVRRMYDVIQADARLFRRLKALGLLDAVRAGRRIRNRIVHQPGYVPSQADTDRALRDYAEAGRKASSEKRAQLMMRPENIQVIYNKLPLGEYAETFANRSERRRSFLSHILTGAAIGTVVGGAGAGALGYGMSTYAGRDAGRPADVVRSAAREAGLRCGLWGASRGALAGAITGIGLGVLDRIRS